jgi:hypothetical protein
VNVNLLPRFEVRKQYYHLVIPPDFVWVMYTNLLFDTASY